VTVNITCQACDGRRLCDACRTAARTLIAAGHRIEHSTRYAALRAAASGTYGFDACVVPVGSHELSVIDAAVSLLSGKRLAFVVDRVADVPESIAHAAALLPSTSYADGSFSLSWLEEGVRPAALQRADETATMSLLHGEPALAIHLQADPSLATRRLKRVADEARVVVARAGLPTPPRLDLIAVLEDEVAWARASETAFGIVLVHLHGLSVQKTSESPAQSEKRVREAEESIAKAVRSTDIVSGRGDDFLVILPESVEDGTDAAAKRIEASIAQSGLRPPAKARRARGFAAWSIGSASYPADGGTRDTLLARATAALRPLR
jgi:GGDEF domain-containing protein